MGVCSRVISALTAAQRQRFDLVSAQVPAVYTGATSAHRCVPAASLRSCGDGTCSRTPDKHGRHQLIPARVPLALWWWANSILADALLKVLRKRCLTCVYTLDIALLCEYLTPEALR